MSTPPGLLGDLVSVSEGGSEHTWLPVTQTRPYTNAFIIQEGKILLGEKKRGFGLGKWNGFGGKVEPGETAVQAAVRELEEECCIRADLEHCATFLFVSEGADFALHVDYYRAENFTGEPTETDEMRPAWFAVPTRRDYEAHFGATSTSHYLRSDVAPSSAQLPSIPWDKIWDDDQYWFPLLFAKKRFQGRVDFEANFGPIRKWWFGLDGTELE